MKLKNSIGINCKSVAMSTILNYYGYPFSEAMCFGLGSSLDFSFSTVRFKKMNFNCVSGNNDNDYYYIAQLLKLKFHVRKFPASKELKDYINKQIKQEVPLISRVSIDKYIDILARKYFKKNETYTFETQKIFKIIQTSAGIHVAVISNLGNDWIQLYEQNIEKPIILPWKTYVKAANPSSVCIMHPANSIYCIEPTQPFEKIERMMDQIAVRAICDNMRNYLYSSSKWYGHKKIKQMLEWLLETLRKQGECRELALFPFFCDTITGGGFYRRIYSHFLEEINEKYIDNNYLKEDAAEFMKISRKWTKVGKKIKGMAMIARREEKEIKEIEEEVLEISDREYKVAVNLIKKGENYLNEYKQ